METKVALLVIYNHRYDKNIVRVKQIYAKRFSYIYHVMPFYDGNDLDVIPVFESSYCFQDIYRKHICIYEGKALRIS